MGQGADDAGEQKREKGERDDEEKPTKRGAGSSPFVNLICGAEIAGEDGHECGKDFPA